MVYVKITETSDFGAVVNHFSVDVQDQVCHRPVGPLSFGGPDGLAQVGIIERPDTVDPAAVGVVELVQRGGRVGGVVPALVVGGRSGEVCVVAHRQHADDDMGESPRDRGERRGLRLRVDEVDRPVAVDRPAVGHRFPEVLVVGQACQAGPQLVGPMPFELLGEVVGEGHVATFPAI